MSPSEYCPPETLPTEGGRLENVELTKVGKWMCKGVGMSISNPDPQSREFLSNYFAANKDLPEYVPLPQYVEDPNDHRFGWFDGERGGVIEKRMVLWSREPFYEHLCTQASYQQMDLPRRPPDSMQIQAAPGESHWATWVARPWL